MEYRIEYLREGVPRGNTPWEGTLEKTIEVARGGLIRHQADFVRIVETGGSGAEVWSERRDIHDR